MNKKEFAKRVSETTGLDEAASAAVIDRIENYNVFNKKENDAVRAAIAETVGCDDEQAEKIRSGIMSVMSGEIKHQIPKAVAAAAALAAVILLAVKLLRGRH
ncbi:hypothetical protein SAMN02910317_00097 [Ruminococcaceae bacterium FB2012]|nr:hypothetical protein SAMN02910317_00097 [Ruminococcaceae bacterium FB2012]